MTGATRGELERALVQGRPAGRGLMGVAWGLLSTAPINLAILAGARESDRIDVIAVASRDGARAEAYARDNGIERAYGGENVSDAIRGEAPLLLGRDDALGQARVIESLYRSAGAGVPVELEQPARADRSAP